MASSISSYGTVSATNTQLYYEQEGNASGPAVLFIHGLGGTTNTYQPLVAALKDDFNLVRFDYAGHGRSGLPKSASIASYVQDAEDVIAHFNLKDVTVVGHSLGGLIALHLAAKNPTLVHNLVLYGPVKAVPQAGRDGLKARAEAVRKGGMAAVADTVVSNALAAHTLASRTEIVGFAREMLARQVPEGYALSCLALAGAADPAWGDVTAATTIVSGAEDKVSSPAVCKAIAENLSAARKVEVVSFEQVGHWHTLEKAAESASVLKKAVLGGAANGAKV